MKIGVVILCRYSSSRLPGKILKEIVGKPSIEHTYSKLREVLDENQIIIATSEEASDDQIATFCDQKKWLCYRGSLTDVAGRFYNAAASQDWDYALRTNGDNIFIDLDVLLAAIELAKQDQYDFISNVKNRTFPKGMSIELVRLSFYKNLLAEIQKNEEYREHVTLIFYGQENRGSCFYLMNNEVKGVQGIDLALDTPQDFRRIEKMIQLMGSNYPNYKLTDIKEAYEQLDR